MSDEILTLLTDAAAAFAKPDAVRVRRLRAADPGFDRTTWRAMADQGWLSVTTPEECDGLGLGLRAAVVIAERLGFALHTEPFVPAGVMATQCVAGCALAGGAGTDSARQLLTTLLSGEAIGVLAWQDQAGQLAPGWRSVSASQCGPGGLGGQGIVLDGTCHFVPVAQADVFIVAAQCAGVPGLYRVAPDAPGVTCTPHPVADGTSMATLHLRGVFVPAADCLASGASAAQLLQGAIDSAMVAVSAELTGVMERSLEMTLDYLRTRKQFGRAIGSFQSLQHRAVDLWTQLQLTRAAVAGAVRVLDDPASDERARRLAASGAKARAAHAALLLTTQAVQLHGAIGFTDEYDLGLYLNRALVLSAWLGNAAEQRRRYGELADPFGTAEAQDAPETTLPSGGEAARVAVAQAAAHSTTQVPA